MRGEYVNENRLYVRYQVREYAELLIGYYTGPSLNQYFLVCTDCSMSPRDFEVKGMGEWRLREGGRTKPQLIHSQDFCNSSTTSLARFSRHSSPSRVGGDLSRHHATAEKYLSPASPRTSCCQFLATISRKTGSSMFCAPPSRCQSSFSSNRFPNANSRSMIPKHAKLLSVGLGACACRGISGLKFAATKGRSSRMLAPSVESVCGKRISSDSHCLRAQGVERSCRCEEASFKAI